MISIKKGIDLPIPNGVENDTIHDYISNAPVAIIGDDYVGLKPTMLVSQGERVSLGQPLFEDKKNPGVFICAPTSGEVIAIERGECRKLLSVIIQPDEHIEKKPLFNAQSLKTLTVLSEEDVRARLQSAGAWAMLRQRPFGKIPAVDGKPHSIFVNAMDSNPLALDPILAYGNREKDYQAGLLVLEKLTDGAIHVCHEGQLRLPFNKTGRVQYHSFSGIHPKGLVGTHIHFIDPVGANKYVWHISLQDLLAIGHLFLTGIPETTKVISVAGAGVKEAKYVRVPRGVNLSLLLAGNKEDFATRVISGSVFAGRAAHGSTDFLGAYDEQVVVLPEGGETTLLEFVRPGMGTYSRTRAYLGRFLKRAQFPFTTALQGSSRPIMPFGIYEEVMPLDILPTLLLKALVIKDTDTAIQLGALELVEEDLALLTYVDPGKHNFGAILRENLTQIEKDG